MVIIGGFFIEVKSDGESDYFHIPPDYDTDDENYITPGDGPDNTNSQDDDYLYPSVGIEPMIRAKIGVISWRTFSPICTIL
jgi:hypothetical protein